MNDLFTEVDVKKELSKFGQECGWVKVNPHESFLAQLRDTMKLENPPRVPKPGFIRPSSLTECIRKLVFEYWATPEEMVYEGTPRIGESGSDAHKRIQTYIAQMKAQNYDVEYYDIKEYLKLYPNPNVEVVDETAEHIVVSTDIHTDIIVYTDRGVEKTRSLIWYMDRYKGPETLLFNKVTKSRFKADGIVKYLGKFYVLEIKTENSKKFASHNKTLEVHSKHTLQGGFYGMNFGIDQVMFLYENRDTCDMFITIMDITPELKNKIKYLIKETLAYGDANQIAPRKVDKNECRFCPYQARCADIGDTFPR